jgi:hypothetical protein
MHIQKKGNAFYLKTSVWNSEKQRSTTVSKYLGSGIETALENLKAEVAEFDYLEIRDKLLKSNIEKPSDIQKELEEIVSDLEKRLDKLVKDGYGDIAIPIYQKTLNKFLEQKTLLIK